MNDAPTNPIAFVRRFNAWRRGDDSEQPQPYQIGQALDALCDHAEQLEQELGSPTDEPDANTTAHARINWWKQRCDELNEQLAAGVRGAELIARMLSDERALADRLANAAINQRGEDESLAAWKASRDPNGASQKPYNPIPSAYEIDAHIDECAARSERDWLPLDGDPNNLEGAGPTEDQRRENARAIQAMTEQERFDLMFHRPNKEQP